MAERDDADADAESEILCRYEGKDVSILALDEARERRRAVERLFRALYEPGDSARVFESAAELEAFATEDEVRALYVEYSKHKRAVDPDPEEMSDEDFAVLEDIIKKKDAIRLRGIASEMPQSCLPTLVDLLATSWSARSSGTPSP